MFCITTQDEHYNKIKIWVISCGTWQEHKFKILFETIHLKIHEKIIMENTLFITGCANEIQNLENWIGFCQYRKF